MCVPICVGMHVMAHGWRSENDFPEWTLFFSITWTLGINHTHSGLEEIFSFQQSCPDPSISIFFYFSLCVYMHKEVLVDVENCPPWLFFLFIKEWFLNQTTKWPIGYSVSLPILLWYVPGVCYQRLGLQWFSSSWHFHGSKNLACGPYICSGMQISPESFYHPFHWLIKIIFYVSELFLW